MNTLTNIRALILFIFLTMGLANLKSQPGFIWGKQFGSTGSEYALNHVVDVNGNIYISGKTTGDMDGKNLGKNDGFITKIDSSGVTIWTRQFGSDGDEDIQWSAIDKNGSVYITGWTTGAIINKSFGREDIFVVKYDPEGRLEWSRQFGTDSTDLAKSIFSDNSGHIYITGSTSGKIGNQSFGKTDAVIMELDSNGNQLYATQFGTPEDDYGYYITGGPDSDVFICGTTWGDLSRKNKGFIDGFTGQFTADGKLIRYTQFGTESFDIALLLDVDEDKNLYIAGTTSGNLGCEQIGEGDCFLMKTTEKGDLIWNKQFGTRNHDSVRGLCISPMASGGIVISGQLSLPPSNGFVRMYNRNGFMIWEENFESSGDNGGKSGKDVTIDNKGNIYHIGLTGSNMFGHAIGEQDVYLVRLKSEFGYKTH
jgi:hypothetical protein